MSFVLVIVLLGGPSNSVPSVATAEFNSQKTCEDAKEAIWTTTKMKVDTLRCVQK